MSFEIKIRANVCFWYTTIALGPTVVYNYVLIEQWYSTFTMVQQWDFH